MPYGNTQIQYRTRLTVFSNFLTTNSFWLPSNKYLSLGKVFAEDLQILGKYIKQHQMRISMHPDQFTLLNSPSETIFQNSVRELLYHTAILDAMGLDNTAKVQIHVGGMYGNREASIERFIER